MRISFGKSGFSLVEVIVASLLLAMITAGVLSVALSSRNIIKRSHLRHSGLQVAETVIESFRQCLRQDYWDNASSLIWPGSGCYCLTGPDPLGIAAHYGGSTFATRHNCTWCYEIRSAPSPYEYREITVNVSWDEDRPQ